MAGPAPLDELPGFRRRVVATPGAGVARAAVEDDYHHMQIAVRHADGVATGVEAKMVRAPWTTCPGAEAQLAHTFTGVALADFPARVGEKTANCTHLYDLAILAAAHAGDARSTVYDVLVADPVEGLSRAELRRNGETLFAWTLRGFTIVEPAEHAGAELWKLKPVLERLDPPGQEAAKVFRWAIMIAHGRAIPLAEQSDATKLPPNCFTFQPHRAAVARRVGVIKDFSRGSERPLDGRIEAR